MLIKYIKYEGKEYPVRVGYYAMRKFKESTGKTMDQITEQDIEAYEDILFYALEQGHKKTGKTMPFKREDMIDILDECFFEFMEIIPEFFPDKQKGEQSKNPKQSTAKKK